MSISDYKRGVKDATIPLTPDEFDRWKLTVTDLGRTLTVISTDYVSKLLADRRKNLSTGKVTKWVAVYTGDKVPLWTDSTLYDSKEAADKAFEKCANYRGAYPIEIEVPL